MAAPVFDDLAGEGLAFVAAVPLPHAGLVAAVDTIPYGLMHTSWTLPAWAADAVLRKVGESVLSAQGPFLASANLFRALANLVRAASPEAALEFADVAAAHSGFISPSRISSLMAGFASHPEALARMLESQGFSNDFLNVAVSNGAVLPSAVVSTMVNQPFRAEDEVTPHLRTKLLALAALTPASEPLLRATLIARGLSAAPLLPLLSAESVYLGVALQDDDALSELVGLYPKSIPLAVLEFVFGSAHPQLLSLISTIVSRRPSPFPASPEVRAALCNAAANPFISTDIFSHILSAAGLTPSAWALKPLSAVDLSASPQAIVAHLDAAIARFDRFGPMVSYTLEPSASFLFPNQALSWNALVRHLISVGAVSEARAAMSEFGVGRVNWPPSLRPFFSYGSGSEPAVPDEWRSQHGECLRRLGDDVSAWQRFFALLVRGLSPSEALLVAR